MEKVLSYIILISPLLIGSLGILVFLSIKLIKTAISKKITKKLPTKTRMVFTILLLIVLAIMAEKIIYRIILFNEKHKKPYITEDNYTHIENYPQYQENPLNLNSLTPTSTFSYLNKSFPLPQHFIHIKNSKDNDFFLIHIYDTLDRGKFISYQSIKIIAPSKKTKEVIEVNLPIDGIKNIKEIYLPTIFNGKIVPENNDYFTIKDYKLIFKKNYFKDISYSIIRTKDASLIKYPRYKENWLEKEFQDIPQEILSYLTKAKNFSYEGKLSVVSFILNTYFGYQKNKDVYLTQKTWNALLKEYVNKKEKLFTDCDVLSTYAYIYLKFLDIYPVFTLGYFNKGNLNTLNDDELHATLYICKDKNKGIIFDPTILVNSYKDGTKTSHCTYCQDYNLSYSHYNLEVFYPDKIYYKKLFTSYSDRIEKEKLSSLIWELKEKEEKINNRSLIIKRVIIIFLLFYLFFFVSAIYRYDRNALSYFVCAITGICILTLMGEIFSSESLNFLYKNILLIPVVVFSFLSNIFFLVKYLYYDKMKIKNLWITNAVFILVLSFLNPNYLRIISFFTILAFYLIKFKKR